MFEEFYEMYESEEQEVVALINRCIGGGYNSVSYTHLKGWVCLRTEPRGGSVWTALKYPL